MLYFLHAVTAVANKILADTVNHPKTSVDKLRLLLDEIEESILHASDEEITEETMNAGKEPAAVADQIGILIQYGIKGHDRRAF